MSHTEKIESLEKRLIKETGIYEAKMEEFTGENKSGIILADVLIYKDRITKTAKELSGLKSLLKTDILK